MLKIIPVIMYQYSSVTGEFLGVCSVEFNTETQAYINAVNCTHLVPPVPSQVHEIAIFRDNMWQLVPDYRRVPLWDINTRDNLTFELGELPDFTQVTMLPPTSDNCEWVIYNGVGEWSKPLNELKADKFIEIREAWHKADTYPCYTNVMDSNNKPIAIQYKSYDREIWQKSIIGIILNMIQEGHILVGVKGEEDTSDDIYITNSDLLTLQLGAVPSSIFIQIKDTETIIRDAFDTYHTITLEQMQSMAICQNLKMQDDLMHKWKLENILKVADSFEKVKAISWGMDLTNIIP